MKVFVAGRIEGRACYGAMTTHHIVPQGRIKKAVRAVNGAQVRALRDSRNLVGCCLGCHLGLVETGNPEAQVRPEDLPAGFQDFLEQYGLEGAVPRHLQAVVR